MEEINDEKIKKIFLTKNGFVSSKMKRKYSNDKESEIYKYIVDRYDDSLSFEESILRICWNISVHPKCKVCGKPVAVKFRKYKFYNDYCSKECVQHDKDIIKKKQNTYFNKTGYTHNSKNPESQKRIKETCLEKYGVKFFNNREKYKQTCLKKYGVDEYMKTREFREKSKESCLKKYGVDEYMKTKEFREKSKESCLEKYGIDNYSKTSKFRKDFLNNIGEIKNKIINTKRKNNTFNTSKEEDKVYEFLSQYIDVTRQFNGGSRYPFNCDFYIEDLDMFIECNFHWTHGKHPFDPSSIKDQVKLEQWKTKRTKYYDNAIKTWTKRDVEKRNKAKEENLNYKEFWSLKELKEFFIDYFENHNIG